MSTKTPLILPSIRKRIIPALLVHSMKEAKQKLAFIDQEYSKAPLHIDVMDGKFVPATSWSKPASVQKLSLKRAFEVHLMVSNPERHIAAWRRAGAAQAIFHIESAKDPKAVISTIRAHHMKAVVALNPATPIAQIELILPLIDGIMLMGVVPGHAGRTLIPSIYRKIAQARKLAPKLPITIDGGVTLQNMPKLVKAGAQFLASTTAVYGSHPYGKTNSKN